MRENQFHVVLQSNSSMRHYNKTSSFTTKLPQTIALHGEWEVALTEIQFPSTFVHLKKEDNILHFIDFVPTKFLHRGEALPKTKEYEIPNGMYKDIHELCDELNKASKEVKSHFYFEAEPRNALRVCFSLTCHENDTEKCRLSHGVNMSDNLYRILGISSAAGIQKDSLLVEQITLIHHNKLRLYKQYFLKFGLRDEEGKRAVSSLCANEPFSLARGIPNKMFVYCDICEPYVVGDVRAPLLRVVPIECHGSDYIYGASQVKYFSPLQYIPLRQTNFRRIEINIKDELGERIPFLSGTLIVTLHFRRYQ
ncbi:uncharacterized protein [Cardiocondyla obscurior]|uniref:uncharacterized protein n=1 Tax=Cardiocondyla obscurior TaxID=286306 RepID=UPI0039657984